MPANPASKLAPVRPVAVIGVDSPIGLTVVRELGERGVPVYAIGRRGDALGRYSRFVTRYFCETGPLADWLPGFAAQHGIGAVMAISEFQLIQLAELRGQLGDCQVLCPPPETLELALDKGRTLAIAAGLGIDVPASWQPVPGDDFAARAAGLAYPVVVKWADPNAVSSRIRAAGLVLEKVEHVADAAKLIAVLGRYTVLQEWPLVQTWAPGVGIGQLLHMQGGECTLAFQHRRLREFPPSGGVSSFCAAEPMDCHSAQLAKSQALLRAMNWQGPAMVEYRHDAASGRYWLMEVNGRFWGSLPLAWHCGAPFAWETWRAAMGAQAPSLAAARKIRRARYVIPDVKHIWLVLRDAELSVGDRAGRLARWLGDFFDPGVRYFVWTWRDPGPFFADLIGILSRRARRDS